MVAGLTMLACTNKKELKSYPFFLGTYTEGNSEGIYRGALNGDGSFDTLRLAVESSNPSFLCFANEQRTLLAVNELNIEGMGTIESYAMTRDGLKLISKSKSGGAHPCHLASNVKGDVLMANYSGGNIGYVSIDQTGEMSALQDVAQHYGQGPTERQTKSHAHSIWFLDDEHAVAVDLGLDQLMFYHLMENRLHKTDSLMLEVGSGPRHLALHPNKRFMYVVNELNSTISVVAKHGDGWQYINSITTLPNDFDGESYCADIHISADGQFLYASNRGHNSLAIYQVNNEGGDLKLIAHESVRGDWPRNFALTPDNEFLVVANQRSNNLVAFKRDMQTGLLTHMNEQKAEMPVCVLFE